jgi:probable metal-binding protein
MESIHGHELMNWMAEQMPMPRPVLLTQAGAKFGFDAVFHTCSHTGLSLAQLVDLLENKGKVGDTQDGTTLLMPACDH